MAQGTLTNLAIKDTYQSILKIGSADGTGAAANANILHATTLKIIEDGDGNNSSIQLAQNRLEIVPVANHANAFEVSQADGTQIFNIASDTPALTINAATITLTQDTNFVTSGGANGMSIDGTTFSVDGANDRVGIGIIPLATLHAKMASNVNFTLTANSADLRINAVNDAVDTAIGLELNASAYEFIGTGDTVFNGKVGIGVAAPDTPLHISGDATVQGTGASSKIIMKDSGGMIDGYVYADGGAVGFLDDDGNWALQINTDSSIVFASNTSTKMTILNSGNVGIGTASPDTLLEVSGAGASVLSTVSCYSDTGTHVPMLLLRKADGTEADPDLVANGDVIGRVSFQGLDADSGGSYIEGANIDCKVNGSPTDDQMPSELQFWTNSGGAATVQRMVIDPSGDVGIGEAVPLAKLHIFTGDSGWPAAGGSHAIDGDYDELCIEGSGNTGITILCPSGNTGAIVFGDEDDKDEGRIKYNHADDSMSFFVDNNANAEFQIAANGSLYASAYGNGDVTFSGGTGLFTTSSDLRMKEDINTLTLDGLSKVNALNPVTFKWREKSLIDGGDVPEYDPDAPNDGIQMGFIAQEVAEIIPQASPDYGDGGQRGICSRPIIAVLVKAIQELTAKVEALENA